MGMFDYVTCEMPLPGNPPAGLEFQTKDGPDFPFMDTLVIRADGRLVRKGYQVEDRSDPNAEGLMRLWGAMTRIPDESLDHVYEDIHQDLVFYNYDHRTGDTWEFKARFTDGVCTHIRLLEEPKMSGRREAAPGRHGSTADGREEASQEETGPGQDEA